MKITITGIRLEKDSSVFQVDDVVIDDVSPELLRLDSAYADFAISLIGDENAVSNLRKAVASFLSSKGLFKPS